MALHFKENAPSPSLNKTVGAGNNLLVKELGEELELKKLLAQL